MGMSPPPIANSLLLHMNGADGSTSFIDSNDPPVLVTTNGNARISTTQSKFGGSSAFFDGTNSFLSISDKTVFNLQSQDFTFEVWIYPTSFSGYSEAATIFGSYGSARAGAYVLYTIGGVLTFYQYPSGNNMLSSGDALPINTWTHVAISRSNNVFMMFINGIKVSTNQLNITLTVDPNNDTTIGRYYPNPTSFFAGYMDEIRLVKGTAVYTDNFTPSTLQFSDT